FTIFKLLHTFIGGATDGEFPQTGHLLQASDGNLYGTTINGGGSTGSAGCPSGCGTVYELSKDSNGNFTFTVLHSFKGGTTDGSTPYGGVIQASDGNLYGTTTAGGTINFGTVYELSKDSNGNFIIFTILRSFSSSTTDGQIPYSGLIQATDGNLYGTSYGGGSANAGAAYELSKDSDGNFTIFTLLHSFTGGATDGSRPQYASLLEASDGNLYGTTDQGGSNASQGVAYELSKDASGKFIVFRLLHSFGAFVGDGSNVQAGLTDASDGNLYGTTAQGGSQDEGTVYSLQTGFNFSLSASPNSVTITPGGAAGTSTIKVNPTNGFTGSVTMSASGLPTGVTASSSPNPTTSTTTLSLTASATAATGTVTATIAGMSGSLTSTTTIDLTVNGAATNTSVQSSLNPS